MRVAVTFDVDVTDYIGTSLFLEEVSEAFPQVRDLLAATPQIRTTWFVRLDRHLETVAGAANCLFVRHQSEFDWLRAGGHELGWHHHGYRRDGARWVQDTDAHRIAQDIAYYGAMARSMGLLCARMGWGFHSDATMHAVADLGFAVDSSAIPRPRYPWEASVKDWEGTPLLPYHPSRCDYRTPGSGPSALGILEVPMTVTAVAAPGDSETVLRYLNLAYRPDIFATAFRQCQDLPLVVTVTHPYELLLERLGRSHALIAGNLTALRENLHFLASQTGVEFVTLSMLSHSVGRP
jgi:hypothetical protein